MQEQYISKLLLPNGITYSIKDELAREQIMFVPISVDYTNNEYTVSTAVSINDIIDAVEEKKIVIGQITVDNNQDINIFATLTKILTEDESLAVYFDIEIDNTSIAIYGESDYNGSTWNDFWGCNIYPKNSIKYIEWHED